VLRQLCDINVFTNIHSEEYIKFTHDRIEEHFLSEYLYAETDNSKAMIRAFKIASVDPIFYSAAVEYFRKLSRQKLFNQVIDSYELLYNHDSDHLPCIVVSCLDALSEETLKQLFFTAEKSKIDTDTFVLFLFSGLKQAIYRNDIKYPEEFVSSYDILAAIFPMLSKHNKYFYYISSRFYLIQKGDIKTAEHYCDLALTNRTDDEYLTRLVDFQKAVIQKHRMQLNDAIDNLSDLYTYFSNCKKWESAAECILEWGSALRKKTMFREALEVYEKIDLQKLEASPAIQTKLHRKKGTIYKNIMQQLLKENVSDYKQEFYNQIYQYYNNAQNEYELAKSKIVRAVDMIEKIKVVSEQTEACLGITDIEPTQMYRAEMLLSEYEHLIASFPILDEKIVYLRLRSKYEEKNGNIREAINILENAREAATAGPEVFRVFEVDYQLGRLIERNKHNLSQTELYKGIDALEKAIHVELDRDNQYIHNCIKSKNELDAFINKNNLQRS
jgi:tetratricopeptide (TPR) repeat protein